MSTTSTHLENLISTLKQERDELKLRMHLASMEAQQEYEKVSEQLDKLSDECEPVTSAVGETADNVLSALGLAAEELRDGLTRVRDAVIEKVDS